MPPTVSHRVAPPKGRDRLAWCRSGKRSDDAAGRGSRVTGRSNPPASGSNLPQLLGSYELVAEIASGGMATVYLARFHGKRHSGRWLAIKRMHPHLAWETGFVQMFLDEGRLATRIRHRCVVPTLEVAHLESGPLIVMEYVEGAPLSDLFSTVTARDERIPPAIVARVMLDTLAGLQAVHEARGERGEPLHIVHRDVSPQNVLVGLDGICRIMDFGLAHAAAGDEEARDGQLKGKVGYMAPEQAKGEPYDQRADLFAVGVMLWEGLAGRRAFKPRQGGSEAEALVRLVNAPLPSLHELDASIDRATSAVCERALQRDPEDRFGSCAEFRAALERAAMGGTGVAPAREVGRFVLEQQGEDIASRRAACGLPGLGVPLRRRRLRQIAATLVGVALACGVAATLALRHCTADGGP